MGREVLSHAPCRAAPSVAPANRLAGEISCVADIDSDEWRFWSDQISIGIVLRSQMWCPIEIILHTSGMYQYSLEYFMTMTMTLSLSLYDITV